MATRRARDPSPWSHEGLERRGYWKCPYCWRHLVKIEEHVAAHQQGRIGPDGRRRDRRPAAHRRLGPVSDGIRTEATNAQRQTFVPRAVLERILRLPPIDGDAFARDVDEAVDQGT